ncbi:MAG: TatD family hydrolase [Deltaproteobacteria bacterium]|nr:TatD family hydrolase [Deltaproteobacteria bacterium]MBW2071931.1 TatD family hydrolase [Deltaproteobacteria bacterium]
MIDTHAHLEEMTDIAGILAGAKEAGIRAIVAVGVDRESNRRTMELARRFAGTVYPAIGYHPWSIHQEGIEENIRFIEEQLDSCVALGEVGLDYKCKVKKKIQWQVFARLLEIAKYHGRPVIVHCRFSHQRAHRMLVEAGIEQAVFHWYSGPLEVLEKILEDGYYISATPALVYSEPQQAAMHMAPLNRILVETDSPVVYQGKPAEPADLLLTLQELSRIKRIDLETVSRETAVNAREFFHI